MRHSLVTESHFKLTSQVALTAYHKYPKQAGNSASSSLSTTHIHTQSFGVGLRSLLQLTLAPPYVSLGLFTGL